MTKAERTRIDAFRFVGCICARLRGWLCLEYDVHHIVDAGYRRLSGGHLATIPLSIWSHRGIPYPGKSEAEMKRLLGPSLALHKREFVAVFGTERSLLAKVNEIIDTGDEALFLGLLKRRETA